MLHFHANIVYSLYDNLENNVNSIFMYFTDVNVIII